MEPAGGFAGGSVAEDSPAHAGGTGDVGGPLEEGMAAHSSVLAWRIPGTEDLAGCD